jgi:GNAT superfamily N-acetyltransferase
MDWTRGEYVLTEDPKRIDRDAVCQLLADTYWASNRSREMICCAIDHSLCFAIFHRGAQVGFARAVTDFATFTYIADVIVHPDHRGRGLGSWLMETMLEHPRLQTLTHCLRTRDAHALYEKFGFQRTEYMRRSSNPF